MIRVLIADDHAQVRRCLREIVEDTPDMEVSGEIAHAGSLLLALRAIRCDVLLVDLTLSGCSGLGFLSLIRQAAPHLPVLILGMHPAEHLALRLVEAGASGYLAKDTAAQNLVRAIRQVFSGGQFILPGLRKTPLRSLERATSASCLIAHRRNGSRTNGCAGPKPG